MHTNQSCPVSVQPFGKTEGGIPVDLYTLENRKGAKVTVMTYGTTIVDIVVPDRDGNLADVSLGFDTFEPYLTKSPYFGCTAGRFANRIRNGKFRLDGSSYELACNDGNNHLHGGLKGFDKQVWTAEILKSDVPAVRFTRVSPDGEEGYPGNLTLSVTYRFSDQNELEIQYEAKTDKETIINLCNHAYFNLAGAGNGSILSHELTLAADRFTPVDDTLIPTGELKPVDGTVLDFRKPVAIGERIQQLGNKPVGYDHNYVLGEKPFSAPQLAARVHEPASGRVMEVYTDQPGIQFYTGNFLDGTITGKGGKVYQQHNGFCLETQHFPDSPNQPQFPSTVLKPGEIFQSTTIYKFSAE